MKPKPDTPQWTAYSAGQRAFRDGLLLKDNPISYRSAAAPLRAWWDTGWRHAQQATQESPRK